MGAENRIITGNTTANANQSLGIKSSGRSIPTDLAAGAYQYGRVIEINTSDRSIRYELIKNNLGTSAIDNSRKFVGIAKNYNPNFTRLPQVGELVPLITGPSARAGSTSGQYDNQTYYMIGPISVQGTVDDNKVPQEVTTATSNPNSVNNYKLNEIGVDFSTTPPPGPPSSILASGLTLSGIAVKNALMNSEDEEKLKTVNAPIADAYRKMQRDFMAWSGKTNSALKLNSGGRNAQTNLHVGGAKDSAHLRNNALDIKLEKGSRPDVLYIIKLATKYGVMGIGIYRDAEDIHIDIDPKLIQKFGGKRAWGPGYGREGVPSWAEKAIQDFLNNKY